MRMPWTTAGTAGYASHGTPLARAEDPGEPGSGDSVQPRAGDLVRPGAGGEPAGYAGPRGRFRGWPAAAAPLLRRHWLAAGLLLAGLVLRVLAQLAYRPALLYIDTVKYLFNAWP